MRFWNPTHHPPPLPGPHLVRRLTPQLLALLSAPRPGWTCSLGGSVAGDVVIIGDPSTYPLSHGAPPSSLQAAGSDPCGRMKEASKVTRVGRMGQQVGKVNKLQRAYCSGDRVSSSDGRQKNIWVLCPAEGERPGPSNLHYRKRKTSMSLSRGRSNSMTMAVETRLKYLAGLISTMRHSVSKNAV